MRHDTLASLRRIAAVLAAFIALMCCGVGEAQNGRPQPERPEPQTPTPSAVENGNGQPLQNDAAQSNQGAPKHDGSNGPVRKRDVAEGRVTLAFNDAAVDEKIIGFIADSTGKVVIPINLPQLRLKKITLINEEPIERAAALDLVLTALRLNGVGISETADVIVLDDIANMPKKPEYQVVTADEDIMNRNDRGNFVVKVYRLREASAEEVYNRLDEVRPDYATLSVDTNSNQVILYGDVGTAQHFQRIINELDRTHVKIAHKTFRLAHADATSVADQIYELFENTQITGAGGQPQQPRQPQQRGAARGAARTGNGGAVAATPAGIATPGPEVELRVSVNVQQNSITVSAEPAKIDSIGRLISEQWDLPRERETFRVYTLQHTDPIKMRDLITNLMGAGSAGGRASGARAGQAGAAGAAPRNAQGAGGGGGVSEAIGDIYRVEAYPDRNTVVVMSKTKEALDYLDMFIRENDQPSYVGLPHVVELKHANAVSLADELNVLLAEAGTGGSLQRPASGLTAEGPGGFSGGTEGGDTGGTAGRAGGTTGGGGGAAGGTIEFPWQRGRARDDQSEPSPLIGKVRIVPIIRQNALAVLAPISQRQAIVELIHQFDRPGRQVMISAIIAEVELTNDMALGLRFSSSAISPTFSDNAITGSVGFEGNSTDVLSKLFDTSVLDVGADINVILQALSQKTNVRIIQQPRIFTADNEEAAFFDGQQIPFITDSVVNSQVNGGVTQSFDYKDVGVLLNVRPRITVQRDVDMEIKLALSAVVPGQTLFGGAILDLRQTTTKVIVKNAQTIVLSGLLKDVDSKVTRGIPLLSDLPIIGEIFKSHENSKSTSELIAFITPIVVDNPSENDSNFNQSEREALLQKSLPMKQENLKAEQQRIREGILAPKSATGEPMPELLPKPPSSGHYPPYEGPAKPKGQSAKPQPEAPQSPPASEPVSDAPPVDIDEVSDDPSS